MENNEQLNSLINSLSKRLDTNPDEIRKTVQSGKVNNILNKMNSSQMSKLQNVLEDKEASEKLLKTPQAQSLIKKLMG